MKFKNIKAGDYVLIEKGIRISYFQSEHFLIKKKVLKVTKTQFVLEDKTRIRKTGEILGDKYSLAYKEGEYYNFMNNERAIDQTAQMNILLKKIKIKNKIKNRIEKINTNSIHQLEIKILEDLFNKVQEIENITKKKGEENE